jgi:hypothetical protein
MKLTKRNLMLLMNGIAITADTLAVQNPGKFPDSTQFDRIQEGRKFGQEVYGANSAIYFYELNDIFAQLLDEVAALDMDEEEINLLNLPPNEYVH